jgi:hypothetical protein
MKKIIMRVVVVRLKRVVRMKIIVRDKRPMRRDLRLPRVVILPPTNG